jgi:hypothetical protein
MRSITDFISNDVAKDSALQDAVSGRASAGGFDGPPLPISRQYRATIVRGEWHQSQAGKYSFAFTFEVTEDIYDEFVGRKFTEYYSIDESANQVAKEKFARLLGESAIPHDQFTGDNEQDAHLFEGTEYVIATRVWGEEDDRTGIRYLNRDRGQKLLDNIPPPKSAKGTKKPLRPDISVNKNRGPQQEEAEEEPFPEGEPDSAESEETVQQQRPINLPGGNSRPGGVNLPPGLAR